MGVEPWTFNFFSFQGQWYGGGESLQAAWPLQKGHIKLSPFVTGDEVIVGCKHCNVTKSAIQAYKADSFFCTNPCTFTMFPIDGMARIIY